MDQGNTEAFYDIHFYNGYSMGAVFHFSINSKYSILISCYITYVILFTVTQDIKNVELSYHPLLRLQGVNHNSRDTLLVCYTWHYVLVGEQSRG